MFSFRYSQSFNVHWIDRQRPDYKLSPSHMDSLDKSPTDIWTKVLEFIKNKFWLRPFSGRLILIQEGVCAVGVCICNIGPCCRIQLPDLRYIDCTVDFSVKTFNASVGMCKDLALRHPEELSLCKPLDPEHLRQNYQVILISRHRSAGILGKN